MTDKNGRTLADVAAIAFVAIALLVGALVAMVAFGGL